MRFVRINIDSLLLRSFNFRHKAKFTKVASKLVSERKLKDFVFESDIEIYIAIIEIKC